MKTRAFLAAFTCVLLGTGVFLGAAAQAGSPTRVRFGAESWYQPQPTCGTALGCLPITPPPLSLYGAGTLHVAVTAGQETARAYLALKSTKLPADPNDVTAPLVIPLDTNASNGSLSPNTANVQVCASTGSLTATEGSFAAPRRADCSTFVKLGYRGGAKPSLTANIAPLLLAHRAPLAAGRLALVLLPNEPKPTDVWHVVFSSDTVKSPSTAPPSLTFVAHSPAPVSSATSAPTPKVTPTKAASSPHHRTPAPPSVVIPPTGGLGLVPSSPVTGIAPPPAVAPSIASTTGGRETFTPTTLTRTLTRNYPYPAILLLPAALLLLAGWIVRLMTRDLTP